jgi:beta-phosphoglucomutase-like phosphatase (HAD superfamily)
MLRLSGLEHLVEVRVDAEAMRAGALRSRPSPDILIAACHRLGVAPEHAATFTHSGAGVTAGLAAGLTVIGVADGSRSGDLRDFGAPNVVPNVAALLDRRLVSGMKNP